MPPKVNIRTIQYRLRKSRWNISLYLLYKLSIKIIKHFNLILWKKKRKINNYILFESQSIWWGDDTRDFLGANKTSADNKSSTTTNTVHTGKKETCEFENNIIFVFVYLDIKIATIDVITEKQIIHICRWSTDFQKFHQIVVLAVYVTANCVF